jgi:choline monooxygenase
MQKIKPIQSTHYTQLPVSYYVDESLFQAEIETIFHAGSRYIAHSLAVPELGDYYALPQEKEGRVLVHGSNGLELMSNVCRHRQAILLRGRGSLLDSYGNSIKGHYGNIVCPLHRWTYSGGIEENTHRPIGTLLGAPHFEQNPCLHLNRYPIQEWNNLIYENNGRNIAQELLPLSVQSHLDFTGYVLDRVEHHECNYNWKTFIEVYLEDYHVSPFHPGLGGFVSCDDLHWEFNPCYSVQTVGISKKIKANNWLSQNSKAGSPIYQRWHDALLAQTPPSAPNIGAIWMLHFPNVMIEYYPHSLTVSTVHAIDIDKTLNIVETYYPEEIYAFDREFVAAQQAAYMETCLEDDEISERMDAGRRALHQRGENEFGPYQSPMEDGMKHFHHWYREKMGNLLTDCAK